MCSMQKLQTRAAPRKTILVVDDNPAWGLLVCDLLGSEYHAIQCLNGAEAEAAYAKYMPDWVWMDISMPGVNGFVAARAILARWRNARIVFVTQHSENGFRREAASIGAVGYVLKDHMSEALDLLRREPVPLLSPNVAMGNASSCRLATR